MQCAGADCKTGQTPLPADKVKHKIPYIQTDMEYYFCSQGKITVWEAVAQVLFHPFLGRHKFEDVDLREREVIANFAA